MLSAVMQQDLASVMLKLPVSARQVNAALFFLARTGYA